MLTLRKCVFAAKKVDNVPGFCIRIIPSATSLFDVAKLSMSRNNVRSVTTGNAICFNNVELVRHQFVDHYVFVLMVKDGVAQPTPTYNSSILEDMFLEENSELLKKTFSVWKELGDALILLKVSIANTYCFNLCLFRSLFKRLWFCADMG